MSKAGEQAKKIVFFYRYNCKDSQVFGMVQTLYRDHGPTPYDALYVELAAATL